MNSVDGEGFAVVRSSLPLPGRIEGKRTTRLDLELSAEDDFTAMALDDGSSLFELAGVVDGDVDIQRARKFVVEGLLSLGVDSWKVEAAVSLLQLYIEHPDRLPEPVKGELPAGSGGPAIWEVDAFVAEFARQALAGNVLVPQMNAAGRLLRTAVAEEEPSQPALFLVERYAVKLISW